MHPERGTFFRYGEPTSERNLANARGNFRAGSEWKYLIHNEPASTSRSFQAVPKSLWNVNSSHYVRSWHTDHFSFAREWENPTPILIFILVGTRTPRSFALSDIKEYSRGARGGEKRKKEKRREKKETPRAKETRFEVSFSSEANKLYVDRVYRVEGKKKEKLHGDPSRKIQASGGKNLINATLLAATDCLELYYNRRTLTCLNTKFVNT